MHVGIIGHGVWLPSTFMSAADIAKATGIPEDVIALKFGVKQKPVSGPGETTAVMGLEAARKALADAGISGSEVDLVIWCGAQHKDYPCWLAGLYVANQIGARNAWSFDMEAMCGSMMTALDVAKSLLLARDDLQTVLLVSGYRNNDLIDLKSGNTVHAGHRLGRLGACPSKRTRAETPCLPPHSGGTALSPRCASCRPWDQKPGLRLPERISRPLHRP